MNNIRIESALDEVYYRLNRLEKVLPQLYDKRIVLYGTGINTKRILDCVKQLNVLGLMDQECTGKYIYNKKVLSEKEIQLLGIDTILVAAEPQSTEIIYKRIVAFCLDNHITILNMYGSNEILLHKNILEQELEYGKLDKGKIKQKILASDELVVSFKNVIYSELVSSEILFFKKLNKELENNGIYIRNFIRYRMMAPKRVPVGDNCSLNQIYRILYTLLKIDETRLARAKAIEEKLILENLYPRTDMIELLKYALSLQKDVYIYSDLMDGDRVIEAFFEKFGIGGYKKIVASGDVLPGLLGRTIRALGEKYGFDKILCIGNEKSDNMIIPQLYHSNFQIIKSSLDMFLSATSLHIFPEELDVLLEHDEINADILQGYNSPFFNQIDSGWIDSLVGKKLGWCEKEGTEDIELLPVNQWDNIDEVEKLVFPKVEAPLVSIIIPAYNQFEYTYNCLQSILLNTDHVSYEVIVADAHSCDFTVKLEDIVTGVSVIHNKENMVFIKNCNNASKTARGKYLVFLNNDTQVQLNWLYPLLECMETQKTAGLVGAKLLNPDGSLQEAGNIVWNNAVAWNYGREKNPQSPDYNYVREVDYISGAAIMISKKLWKEIGGFDERYAPAYWEDVDLAFEVRKRGKRVFYQPDSIVVHFEGLSNGKNIESGLKRYQEINKEKFLEKWRTELIENQYPESENILAACERKAKRKTVLFVSEGVPTYDKDAGSRTLDFYIKEFLRREYIVKFIPDSFVREEPYTHRLEQMGVEVFYGKYYRKTIMNWIRGNCNNIDFAFISYPNASRKYIDILKESGIPVMYYGMDLHYLRLQREYRLHGDKKKAEEAKAFYEKEAYLIKNSDSVYYPSLVEAEIIRKEFHRNDVKQLLINIYDVSTICNCYEPEKREGIMFIGGYRHTPNVDAVLWFSAEIFPRIYERLGISFYVAGADMSVDINSIDREGVIRLGTLTDSELEKMYAKVKLMVIPLRFGAGIKGKVIEAMYHGIPVVTTSIGMEGIPNENDAVKIADCDTDFADAVIEVYQSNAELIRMSLAGQEIIKRYYSREAAWNNIADDFI